MMGGPLNVRSEDEESRRLLLREVARVFKRATPEERCWLCDQIAEARKRIHARARRDDVDMAIALMEGKE